VIGSQESFKLTAASKSKLPVHVEIDSFEDVG